MPANEVVRRPQQDVSTPALAVAAGCTHGRCHFCGFFLDTPFEMRPMADIEADIGRIAKTMMAHERRIFLAGGNPYALSADKLVRIFDAVEARIPQVDSYGGFCRISDVARKSDGDLALLAARGVSDIAIGAESGCDETLAFMEKGQTAADVAEQGRRLHEAGIEFTYFYLAGLAGHGRGRRNAVESARAFSAAAPKRILIMSMTPVAGWRLSEDIEAGLWSPPGEVEMAEEIRTFVANLDCETYVNCGHDTDVVRFECALPVQRDAALALLDDRIARMDESSARAFRLAFGSGSWEWNW